MAKIVPIQTGNFSVGGVTYDVESVTLDGTQDIYEYIPLGQGDNPVAYKVVGGVIRLNGTIEASIGDDELGTGYLPAPFSRTLVTYQRHLRGSDQQRQLAVGQRQHGSFQSAIRVARRHHVQCGCLT